MGVFSTTPSLALVGLFPAVFFGLATGLAAELDALPLSLFVRGMAEKSFASFAGLDRCVTRKPRFFGHVIKIQFWPRGQKQTSDHSPCQPELVQLAFL
jgi:hypothetical protein